MEIEKKYKNASDRFVKKTKDGKIDLYNQSDDFYEYYAINRPEKIDHIESPHSVPNEEIVNNLPLIPKSQKIKLNNEWAPSTGNIHLFNEYVSPQIKLLCELSKTCSAPQRSDAWHRFRRHKITGSIVDSILGTNPYETPKKVMIKKLKQTIGEERRMEATRAMLHGVHYEDEALKLYEKLTGRKVIEFGLLQSINPNEEMFASSPDGITVDGILIEVKCPYRRKPKGEIPKYYYGQVMYQLHILGLKKAHFIEYVPISKDHTWDDLETEPPFIDIMEYDYDKEWIDKNIPVLRAWYDEYVRLSQREDLKEFINEFTEMCDLDKNDKFKVKRMKKRRKMIKEYTKKEMDLTPDYNAEFYIRHKKNHFPFDLPELYIHKEKKENMDEHFPFMDDFINNHDNDNDNKTTNE